MRWEEIEGKPNLVTSSQYEEALRQIRTLRYIVYGLIAAQVLFLQLLYVVAS